MPSNPSDSPEPEAENVRAIRQLVRLMKKYDLTAIDFVEGKTQIRLRRRGPEPYAAASPAGTWTPAPAMTAAPLPAPAAPSAPSPAAPAAPAGVTIDSPMVGTYYASSSPDAPPFVSVGSQVRAETTVCVIEAMKVFTDIPAGIPAGVTGTIAEVLVKNGQPVEYGQPLFRVTLA